MSTMTAVNTLTAESMMSALVQYDDMTLTKIEEHIKSIRTTSKEKAEQEIRELEQRLTALKAKSNIRKFKQFVNPNNEREVYMTGQYPDWLIDLAKSKGINTNDRKKAMKKFVRENSK